MSNNSSFSESAKLTAVIVKDKESLLSKNRIKRLCKNLAIKTAKVALFSGGVLALSAYSSLSNNNAFDINGINKVHNYSIEDVISNLGPKSLHVNEKYISEKNRVIIISERDQELAHIISNVDESIFPRYLNEDENIFEVSERLMFDAYHNVFNPNDDIERSWSVYSLKSDTFGPHAYSKFKDKEWDNFKACYMKPYKNNVQSNDGFQAGQNNAKIFFHGYEMVTLVKNHEEGHCLDFGDAHHYESIHDGKPIAPQGMETLQKEIISDLYASLISIRDSGNLDTVRYTMIPFRMMPNSDPDHQSTVILKKFTDDFDTKENIDGIKNSTDLQLFEMAQNYYSENNIDIHKKEMDKFSSSESLFRSLLVNEISLGNAAAKILRDITYDDVSEINQIELWENLDSTIDYGEELMKVYAEHLQYHNEDMNIDSLLSLAKIASKVYHFKGEHEKAKGIEDSFSVESPYELNKIVFNAISDMEIKLDNVEGKLDTNIAAFKARHESDKKRISDINDSLEAGIYDFQKILLDKNPGTKQIIIDKLRKQNKPESSDENTMG